MRFTPDGKKLISGDENEPLYVWDLGSGKRLHSLGRFGDDRMFALSRDGRLVAWVNRDAGGARGEYTVPVTDVTTGKEVHVLHKAAGGRAPFHGALALAPDGTTLAGGVQDAIYLWDLATGKELRRWVADPRQVTALAFAADGKALASSGADTPIRLWDPATGKEVAATAGHRGAVGVVLSPDGRHAAALGRGHGPGAGHPGRPRGRRQRGGAFPGRQGAGRGRRGRDHPSLGRGWWQGTAPLAGDS